MPLFAQHQLCGKVVVNGEVQSGVLVTLSVINDTTRTDRAGQFCFEEVDAGNYLLLAEFNGFLSQPLPVAVNGQGADILLPLDFMDGRLDAVQITAQSDAKIRKNHSMKTEVVNLNQLRQASVSVEESMNRAVGIRIRNSGGLGASADVLVGGVNGKSVRFLIDGIPVDYLGTSMSLTKLPAGLPDYIEIYKGVLPAEIGIDALGAAVNIVTKKEETDRRRFSYEAGSFRTHRFSLSAVHRLSDKLIFGISGFMNYAGNNFKVSGLPVENPATGRMEEITAPLFHNGFRQVNGELFAALENMTWADRLKISLNSFALKKELQNDFASRNRPYGEVYMREHTAAVPSVLYEKSLFAEKLKLSQFLVFSSINYTLADPLKNGYYDWYGNKHESVSGSETGMDLTHTASRRVDTRINNFTSRSLFTYTVNSGQKLVLNLINNSLQRRTDDLSRDNTKKDINFNRFIAGLGYEYHLFDNRAEGLTQIKFLSSKTTGTEDDLMGAPVKITTSTGSWSLSQSAKYQLFEDWMLRASIENTYRLPDQTEIFGDNVFIVPNFSIRPEKSLNINAGIRFERFSKISLEANTYFRSMKNMIRLKEITQFQAQYLNLDKVQGYGVELEGQIHVTSRFLLHGNLTYNEFRFKGSNNNFSDDSHFINARVSNMPFYFGNLGASYVFRNILKREDTTRVYWSYSYVHQFYLDFIEKQYEPDGFLGLYGQSKIYTSRIIPMQRVHAAGVVWSAFFRDNYMFSLSAEAENIFDAPVYNNFKMQSAGRSISAKITFEF